MSAKNTNPTPEALLTSFGFSLFPVKGKKPTGPWTAYQTARASMETLQRWQESHDAFAIATGEISGVVVVDTDTPEAEKWAEANLPDTPWVVLTGYKDKFPGFRGRHRYYGYPPDTTISNGASVEVGGVKMKGLDIRGQGGYVVAPPSPHPSGVRYEVTQEWKPEDKDGLPLFSQAWFDAPVRTRKEPPPVHEVVRPSASAYERAAKWLSKKETPYEGERNHECYSAACSLFDFQLSRHEVESLMIPWNRSFSSPLPESELLRTIESAEKGRQAPKYPKGTMVGNGSRTLGSASPVSTESKAVSLLEVLKPIKALEKEYDFQELKMALDSIAAQAPELSPLDRKLLLSELVRELKRIKAPGPTDLAKVALRAEEEEDQEDDKLGLSPTTPWPEPVNGDKVAQQVEGVFNKYMVLPDGAAVAATLWVLMTYITFWLFIATRLAITSPTKRCGKSTFLALIAALAEKVVAASSMSPAAIFRLVEAYSPTLLIDEADTWLPQNEEVRGIINAGFMRAQSKVYRCSGDDHTVTGFETFAPLGLAGIRHVPDTIRDRSIIIEMRRKKSGEQVSRLRLDRLLDETRDLKRKIARWAADHGESISQADPSVPPGLSDRAADCWRPLLAIADALGGEWPAKAYAAAVALSSKGEDSSDEDMSVVLLEDIREIFESRNTERIRTETLLDDLHARDDRPWREWSKGKPITPHKLARLLEGFKIRAKLIRFASGPARGFERAAFEDSFSRYLAPLDESVTTLHSNNDKGSRDLSECYGKSSVTVCEDKRAAQPSHCNTVTLCEGEISFDELEELEISI